MSVISSGDRRAGGEDLLERPSTGIYGWDLCREFVDQVVSDALAMAGRDPSGTAVPEVDWDAIWRAGTARLLTRWRSVASFGLRREWQPRSPGDDLLWDRIVRSR